MSQKSQTINDDLAEFIKETNTKIGLKSHPRIQELVALGGGDWGFVTDLLAVFNEQSPPLLQGMKEGCLKNNHTLAERSAHKLKGSCRELGFSSVTESCDIFERLCANKDIGSAAAMLPKIELLYLKIECEIRNYLEEAAS